MPSNKDRLYIALYAQDEKYTMLGKEDMYHWAFIVGPKDDDDTGMRFHVKQRLVGSTASSAWVFEERETTMGATSMQLVRVMIAKVQKQDRLTSIIRETKVGQDTVGCNNIVWIQDVLRNLEADGKALGTGVIEWTQVRNAVMEYCEQKRDRHRFDGQGNYDKSRVATYDLIEGKERIP